MGGRPIWPGLLRHFGDDCTVIWFGGAPAVRAPLHSSHQSDVYVPDGEGARVARKGRELLSMTMCSCLAPTFLLPGAPRAHFLILLWSQPMWIRSTLVSV